MSEARIGRLVAACLHEAISELLPQRVDFYEHWLHGASLRDGAIGLAPLSAVLSFLRTEGDTYHAVMTRAGTLAAEWSVMATPGQRRMMAAMPAFLRRRLAVRAATRLIAQVSSTSRATAKLRQGIARVEIRESLFCAVREPQKAPLCDFYLAAARRTLELLGLAEAAAAVRVDECRAVNGHACVLSMDLSGAGRPEAA